MEGTFWAFLPAIVAIVLALISKQVYISLFFGIFVGAMMYAGGNPLKALFTLFNVMSEKVGANVPIIVAVNKIDKPESNIERVKTQLADNGLLPEEWGGDAILLSGICSRRSFKNFLILLNKLLSNALNKTN